MNQRVVGIIRCHPQTIETYRNLPINFRTAPYLNLLATLKRSLSMEMCLPTTDISCGHLPAFLSLSKRWNNCRIPDWTNCPWNDAVNQRPFLRSPIIYLPFCGTLRKRLRDRSLPSLSPQSVNHGKPRGSRGWLDFTLRRVSAENLKIILATEDNTWMYNLCHISSRSLFLLNNSVFSKRIYRLTDWECFFTERRVLMKEM